MRTRPKQSMTRRVRWLPAPGAPTVSSALPTSAPTRAQRTTAVPVRRQPDSDPPGAMIGAARWVWALRVTVTAPVAAHASAGPFVFASAVTVTSRAVSRAMSQSTTSSTPAGAASPDAAQSPPDAAATLTPVISGAARAVRVAVAAPSGSPA